MANKPVFTGIRVCRWGEERGEYEDLIPARKNVFEISGNGNGPTSQDSCHDPRNVSHLTSSTYSLNHCTISLPIW